MAAPTTTSAEDASVQQTNQPPASTLNVDMIINKLLANKENPSKAVSTGPQEQLH